MTPEGCSLNPARSTGGRKCGPEGVSRGRLCSNGVYATAGAIASQDSWLLTRQGKVDSASGRGEAELPWELWKDWSWEVTLAVGQGLSILRRVTVRFTVQTGILLSVKSSTTQLHYHRRCVQTLPGRQGCTLILSSAACLTQMIQSDEGNRQDNILLASEGQREGRSRHELVLTYTRL